MSEEQTRNQHIKRQPRRPDGRVVSAYTDAQLYTLVRKAAFKARPGVPVELSVSGYDATIATLGYQDAPSARAICGRLKKGWPEIVELALTPKQHDKRRDDKRPEVAPWMTERHLFFALNVIAHFKQVETMTMNDYEAWLGDYLGSRPQPAHILADNSRFPSANQIVRIAETLPEDKQATTLWDRALIYAELQPVAKSVSNALSTKEAINLYIEASGGEFYPSFNELPRLRKEFGISIREKEEGRLWSEQIEEVLDDRKAAGLPVPSKQATRRIKVTLALPQDADAPQLKNAKGTWEAKSDDELAELLVSYALDCAQRTPPVRPTKRGYQTWQVGRKEHPSAERYGERRNWGDWMAMVEELLLEQKKAA